MMSDILLFAAGSLRLAFAPLLSAFQRHAGQKVTAEFGPAGLLRQRIENGERPQLFASANVAHPQRLADLGMAGAVQVFARNRLCVTVRNVPALTERPLPEVLCDPRWRLATSTPGADPSGDYAQRLFERCEQYWPGQGGSATPAGVTVSRRDRFCTGAGRPTGGGVSDNPRAGGYFSRLCQLCSGFSGLPGVGGAAAGAAVGYRGGLWFMPVG